MKVMNNSNKNIEVEERNKKRGLYFSIGVHVVLFLIALLPLMTYPDPPPEKEGILVNFGAPDQGQGQDAPQTQKSDEISPEPPVEEVEPEPEPEPEVEQTEESEASRLKPEEKILTAEDSEVKIKEQAEKAKQQSEAQRKAEAEAMRKKEEEAERKRKQEEYEASKSGFSEAFKGSGKGSTDKPGSEGDTKGDPDAEKLKGISTGKGKIGGGLSDRGVAFEPAIRDQTQKAGRVVIKVCVDANGNVTSADYTQRGSTTTDSELRRIAESAARKFRFTEGELDRQCGTITIDFRLQ